MIRFGRVEVTGGFLLLLAWLNYLDRTFLVPLALLACGAHEMGHIFVIRLLGIEVKEVRLTAIGAELVLARLPGYWQEGIAALAGPGVNLVLALICCGFEKCLTFAGLNLVLALFNMLPAGRLDGGRALYCTLALLAGPDLAAWVCGELDLLCMAAVLTAGFLLAKENITLLLVAAWLAATCLRDRFAARQKANFSS